MTDTERNQVDMHADFFDRCEFALENGFYLEAILMEYAAIESRLESICGVLGFPCGKNCPCRKDIKISARIDCLRFYRNKNKEVFIRTKLPDSFFTRKGEMKTWITERDKRVHGLYKDEIKYKERIQENRELAEQGYFYSRLLYNEAKRLRRLVKSHPDLFDDVIIICKKAKCQGNKEENT